MSYYELYYSTGGHVGAFDSVLDAKMAALQRLDGDKNLDYVSIQNRSTHAEVARITRDHLCMVADEMGKKVPSAVAKINMAQFEIKATIILAGVSDIELNNSEVLHADVLDMLQARLASRTGDYEITLDEVYEIDDWR